MHDCVPARHLRQLDKFQSVLHNIISRSVYGKSCFDALITVQEISGLPADKISLCGLPYIPFKSIAGTIASVSTEKPTRNLFLVKLWRPEVRGIPKVVVTGV